MTTVPLAWDPNQLWNKALRYAARANRAVDERPAGMLYSCLALELLSRAVLTSIHPCLNADPQSEGAHIMYACGIPSRGQPKSIPVHAVFARLEVAYPEFKRHSKVCAYLMNLRNEEVHTGAVPMDSLNEAKWLADYYGAVLWLCEKLKRKPDLYLGDATSHARELVAAAAGTRRAEVIKRIADAKQAFEKLSKKASEDARQRATDALRFEPGRAAECPACGSPALLHGQEIVRSAPSYDQGELVVAIACATAELRCSACELHLRTIDECAAAAVTPRFTVYEATSLHDLHHDESPEEYDNM